MNEFKKTEIAEDLNRLKVWTGVLELALFAPDGEVTFTGRDALVTFAGDIARLASKAEAKALHKNIDTPNTLLDIDQLSS